eukprot:11086676-Alexandrium_andersonii.AAC.1
MSDDPRRPELVPQAFLEGLDELLALRVAVLVPPGAEQAPRDQEARRLVRHEQPLVDPVGQLAA